MRRRTLLRVAAAAMLVATAAGAEISGPVNYIIPFAPGGESDITARLQQPFFRDRFGQELVVSYQTGGGGATAWAALNGMEDSGHTIMGVNLPHIIIQPAQKDVGYRTEDLNIFYMFHFTPDAIVVRADSPYQTLDDFIADAQANPGAVTIAGTGKASANHLTQIKFDKMAGIQTTYVPFGGTGDAITAMLGGQVKAQWGYTTVGAGQGEQVRLLAVATEERHPLFPDVPTFKELGYDLTGGAYRGLALPKSASAEVTQEWSDRIEAINKDPEFIRMMLDGGYAMLDVPLAEIEAWMDQKSQEYLDDAREAGLIQ